MRPMSRGSVGHQSTEAPEAFTAAPLVDPAFHETIELSSRGRRKAPIHARE